MAKCRVVIPGKAYACAECGAVYSGMNCKNMASRCYDGHQKSSFAYRPPEARPRLDKEPGEGTEYPDRWNHWRRLVYGSEEYNKVQINRANHNLQKREGKIDKLLSDFLTGKPQIWKDSISPLQRLAYAYHHGGWEAIKQAAYNLAYSEAIQQRLDDLNIPDVLRQLLGMENMLREMLDDADFMRFKEAKNDVEALANKLEIDSFLDSLDLSDFPGKEGNDVDS